MELNGLSENSQRNGLDNQAFHSQDSVCIYVEVAHRPSEELKKRFLEKRMEGIHRYLEEHRTRIRLVLGIALAADNRHPPMLALCSGRWPNDSCYSQTMRHPENRSSQENNTRCVRRV